MSLKSLSIGLTLVILAGSAATARDLPFAPKKKQAAPTNPLVFSPFEHEAVMATLEPGWKISHNVAEEKKFRLMQFLDPTSTPDDIKKMINVATYMDAPAKQTAYDFMMHAKKETEKAVPKGKWEFAAISDTNPNDVIFELSIKGWIESPDQYEMERVMHGKDGMHAVVYHLSNPNASDDEKKHALAFLKSVKLVRKEDADKLDAANSGKTATK